MSKKKKKRKQPQKPQQKKRSHRSSGGGGASGGSGGGGSGGSSGGSSGGGTMMKLRGGFKGVVHGSDKKAKTPLGRVFDILFWVALAALLGFILYSKFLKSRS